MKVCEFLMIDDNPCNELAVERVGKKWYCLEHAARLKFDGAICYAFTNEDEEIEVDEEEYYNDQQGLL